MTEPVPTPQVEVAPTGVARSAIGEWTSAVDVWGQAELGREMLSAWATGWSAWGDYCRHLATAAGPTGMLDAALRLMTDGVEIWGRTAAARLQSGGLHTPLLNDA